MFKKQPLRTQKTVGEQLQLAREARGVSIAECSRRLKISAAHLQALEEGRYNDLPSPVYIKHYVQLYASLVGMPWERIAETYEQEIHVFYAPQDQGIVGPEERSHIRSTKRHRSPSASGHQRRALVVPRLLKYGVIGIVVLLLGVYFVWQVVQFLSPPDLTVSQPVGDVIVHQSRVLVEGRTEPESIVEINDQSVAVGQDGRFSEEVFVHSGLNTIRITTRSKQSGERAEVRHILYEPVEQVEEEGE